MPELPLWLDAVLHFILNSFTCRTSETKEGRTSSHNHTSGGGLAAKYFAGEYSELMLQFPFKNVIRLYSMRLPLQQCMSAEGSSYIESYYLISFKILLVIISCYFFSGGAQEGGSQVPVPGEPGDSAAGVRVGTLPGPCRLAHRNGIPTCGLDLCNVIGMMESLSRLRCEMIAGYCRV